ncbi:hypothetical protein KQJ29_33875, partial [Enterococcus sp. S181_ASV_20]|nr:hypothetical protein [Enterococcus sp. S181_ASV_20]
MQYSLAVNLASSLELSGDEVNWSSNPATGFYQDPTNHPHRWGEHLVCLLYTSDAADEVGC